MVTESPLVFPNRMITGKVHQDRFKGHMVTYEVLWVNDGERFYINVHFQPRGLQGRKMEAVVNWKEVKPVAKEWCKRKVVVEEVRVDRFRELIGEYMGGVTLSCELQR